jgi:DNA-binding NtrC family response regulator
VDRGAFRRDLLYRLNVVHIRIPPLRERPEDIPLLVTRFHEQIAGGAPPASLLADLTSRPWPGNVRELRGAVERAALLGASSLREEAIGAAPGSEPPVEDAEPAMDLSRPFREAKERAVARWERAYLEALIRAAGGNLSCAARLAHMDRNHLRELVRRHAIIAARED